MRKPVSSMSADVQGPVRTCVGCRQRADKQRLLRVVAGENGYGLEAVPDPAGRAPGRGAHLHPTSECLGLALRRRAFARALRHDAVDSGKKRGAMGLEGVREHLAPTDGETK